MLLSPRARHPRPVGGGREEEQERPGRGDRDQRRTAREQPAHRHERADRRRPQPRGGERRHDEQRGGIFVSNPSPTATPASTSHRVRPSSSARTTNHSAATEHRISSASGLLWREMATVIGVVASTSPATKPAARPNRRRVRS
jgi:hypothetical protein